MSSCLPCGGPPSISKLLARCYPPPKQLETGDVATIRPLKSELSELVSALRERPGQLGRVGAELEKRVGKDASRIAGGDARPRTSLLISLSILKSLVVDFRSDLKLLSRPAIRIFQTALDVRDPVKGGMDFEAVGRTVSAFIASSTHVRAETVTPDASVHSTYLLVLRKLASMAIFTPSSEKPDQELQHRTRMIALSGVYASLTSPTLLGSSANDFGKQAGITVTPLLANLFEAQMDQLKLQSDKVEREASDDRRAPSVRAHLPTEKAPDSTAVLHLALKSLRDLVAQAQTAQLSSIVDGVLDYLDKRNGWQDVERCCWLAERMTEGAMLQYRYVVPTRLIELLVDMKDVEPGPKQTTILAMTMTILNSSISLVGLGVIYILDSLVGLTIRRIRCDPQDALLPPLVQCISSLAAHIYYVEQVNEMVEEIAYRLPDIPSSDTSRTHIVRVLLYCIIGVMHVAQRGDDMEARRSSIPHPDVPAKGKNPLPSGYETPKRLRPQRRSPISPDVWQETLPLLCESTYAVRAAYARALVLFIERELPREDKSSSGIGEPAVHRFCSALHATVYTLAMSSCLGTGSPAPSVDSPKQLSPAAHAPDLPTAPEAAAAGSAPLAASDSKPSTPSEDKGKDKPERGVSFNITEPTPLDTPTETGQATPTGQGTPSRKASRSLRRVSLPLNRLNSYAVLDSFENVATPFDFSAILKVLEELYKAVPLSALSTGVPMLLALDADAGNQLIRRPGDERTGSWVLERRRAIRETVGFCWLRISQQWGIQPVQDLANKTIERMPEPLVVPAYQPLPEYTILPPPDQSFSFVPHEIEGESSSASKPLLDRDTILSALASSSDIQRASGWDSSSLMRRLDTSWSVENALKNSVDRSSDIMHTANANASTHSFLRPQSRVIDVHDLRLALDGRGEGTSSRTPSLRSASIRAQSVADERPRSRHGHFQHADVKEVLKEIFKDKKRGQPAVADANPIGSKGAHAEPEGVEGTKGVSEPQMANGGIVSGDHEVEKQHQATSSLSPGRYPIELGKVIS